MSDVVFQPKAGVDPDGLGAVFVNDEGDVNVREAVLATDTGDDHRFVSSPKGYIVARDPAVIAALDNYEQVKRSSLPEPKKKDK